MYRQKVALKKQRTLTVTLVVIGVARIFDWGGGGQTTTYMQCRHQKFSKEEVFVGRRYRRIDD